MPVYKAAVLPTPVHEAADLDARRCYTEGRYLDSGDGILPPGSHACQMERQREGASERLGVDATAGRLMRFRFPLRSWQRSANYLQRNLLFTVTVARKIVSRALNLKQRAVVNTIVSVESRDSVFDYFFFLTKFPFFCLQNLFFRTSDPS